MSSEIKHKPQSIADRGHGSCRKATACLLDYLFLVYACDLIAKRI
jgi:hypothetical protein